MKKSACDHWIGGILLLEKSTFISTTSIAFNLMDWIINKWTWRSSTAQKTCMSYSGY